MGSVTIIWGLGGVLAAACFGRAIAMRTAPRALQELLWYTIGALILAGTCLLWASIEPGFVMQQRIVLAVIGALAGALALTTIGESIRPHPASAQSKQEQPGIPFAQVAQNVTSYSQSGGITAGTVNIGPVPRSLNNEVWAVPLKAKILRELPRDKPITVMAVMGDSEAISLAQEIAAFLKANGFPLTEDGGISQGIFSGPVKGLGVRDDGKTRTFIVGANQP